MYIFSFMSEALHAESLPDKPPQFLPSDDSVQGQQQQPQPAEQHQAPLQQAPPGKQHAAADAGPQAAVNQPEDEIVAVPPHINQDVENRPPAPSQSADQGAGELAAEIVIKYPDGQEERISVLDADPVHRIARAGQVLTTPLSASYPNHTTTADSHNKLTCNIGGWC